MRQRVGLIVNLNRAIVLTQVGREGGGGPPDKARGGGDVKAQSSHQHLIMASISVSVCCPAVPIIIAEAEFKAAKFRCPAAGDSVGCWQLAAGSWQAALPENFQLVAGLGANWQPVAVLDLGAADGGPC